LSITDTSFAPFFDFLDNLEQVKLRPGEPVEAVHCGLIARA
jgi:hypothetical protein